MRIGVTSQNSLKVNAVLNAYKAFTVTPEVIGFASNSSVNEQPVNEETLLGARNRIYDLQGKATGLDRIVSIESGIFEEFGQWVDKAIVVIYDTQKGQEHIAYSDSVPFPTKYVDKARDIGFKTMTVGKVMAQAGYIANNSDPHLSIIGRSRQAYIEDVVRKLVTKIETAPGK